MEDAEDVDEESSNEILGNDEAGTLTDGYVEPDGPDPDGIPDPMDDAIGGLPEPGDEIGDMEGQQPTG